MPVYATIHAAASAGELGPTAKCNVCGRRIRLDLIYEHAETCDSEMPAAYSPRAIRGTTALIHGQVPALPGHGPQPIVLALR